MLNQPTFLTVSVSVILAGLERTVQGVSMHAMLGRQRTFT